MKIKKVKKKYRVVGVKVNLKQYILKQAFIVHSSLP